MRRALIVLVAVCCCGAFSVSQTADELIAKNIEARGGIEKMKAIKTLRMTGKFEGGGGFTASVGQENERPNLIRQTFVLQGMTAVQAYDGTTGWQIQPFQGKKDPELMGEDDRRDLLLDAEFDGPLVDYKEKGSTVEFLGHDVADGDDALRLKVTLKNGDIIYDYLDPDTFIEFRREIQQFIRGSVRDRVVGLGSYKPVNGVMFPFSLSSGPKNHPDAQTTMVQKMEANVTIDPADFALPASLKTEEKKSGIVGIK
ncbi:MAG TPA: hypothetical protein VFF64_00535 [Candidatus Eremiobacteraceae bacterium]|nr:hypothetical protein [Candidatus Eremiobacteraceae bacterium]